MKTIMLSLVVLSAVNAAAAVQFVSGPQGWASAMGFKATPQPWDNVKLPPHVKRAVTPTRQELTTRNPHIPDSKSVKIRYGPYTVPAPSVAGGEGMINNQPNPWVDKPCTSCMILGMNAGLEYAEGADANTDTKMWLHHMIGSGVWDATCASRFGAPHLIVGSSSGSSERIFSSGNERTTTFFNPPWANVTNLGYPVYTTDRFGIIVDLMNMNPASKVVYLTIYYDYVEGHPTQFDEVKPVWLDAFQCMTSEVSGRSARSIFDVSSAPWVANFEGEVLGVGGHLHDGGTKLDVIVDRQVICSSFPTYGTDEEAKARADVAKQGGIAEAAPGSPSMAHGVTTPAAGAHGHGGQHIIAMSICADNKSGVKNIPVSPLKIKNLKKGQSWTLKGYYDYTKHAGMKNSRGQMESVMGISIFYVRTATKRT